MCRSSLAQFARGFTLFRCSPKARSFVRSSWLCEGNPVFLLASRSSLLQLWTNRYRPLAPTGGVQRAELKLLFSRFLPASAVDVRELMCFLLPFSFLTLVWCVFLIFPERGDLRVSGRFRSHESRVELGGKEEGIEEGNKKKCIKVGTDTGGEAKIPLFQLESSIRINWRSGACFFGRGWRFFGWKNVKSRPWSCWQPQPIATISPAVLISCYKLLHYHLNIRFKPNNYNICNPTQASPPSNRSVNCTNQNN